MLCWQLSWPSAEYLTVFLSLHLLVCVFSDSCHWQINLLLRVIIHTYICLYFECFVAKHPTLCLTKFCSHPIMLNFICSYTVNKTNRDNLWEYYFMELNFRLIWTFSISPMSKYDTNSIVKKLCPPFSAICTTARPLYLCLIKLEFVMKKYKRTRTSFKLSVHS